MPDNETKYIEKEKRLNKVRFAKAQNEALAKQKRNYIIIMSILFVIMMCLIFGICMEMRKYNQNTKSIKEAQQYIGKNKIDWEGLQKINPDIIGWIYLPKSDINYPILKSHDNSEYLSRGYNKKYNVAGSIFTDFRHKEPFESRNTIVYGHRMANGSMFHTITDYKDQKFYDEHDKIYIYTPQKDYIMQVLSFTRVKHNSKFYNIIEEETNDKAEQNQKINNLISYINNHNLIRYNAFYHVKETDNFVTLSTCAQRGLYQNGVREILFGNLIENKDNVFPEINIK